MIKDTKFKSIENNIRLSKCIIDTIDIFLSTIYFAFQYEREFANNYHSSVSYIIDVLYNKYSIMCLNIISNNKIYDTIV